MRLWNLESDHKIETTHQVDTIISLHRRFVFAPSAREHLPLLVESIGYNPDQEYISRPEGYPMFHWIQTVRGQGTLKTKEREYILEPGSGMLLLPHAAHMYEGNLEQWETLYLTFTGVAAAAIVAAYGIQESTLFHWEQEAGMDKLLYEMMERLEQSEDALGLETSLGIYRFLGILSKFGRRHNFTAVARNLEVLKPLLDWMEIQVGNPDVGLGDFAQLLGFSGRHLSSLFQQTFRISPYAYFLQIRLRKAKEMLVGSSGTHTSISSISGSCGFRDVSHFVATFRKATGLTPEQFRRLY